MDPFLKVAPITAVNKSLHTSSGSTFFNLEAPGSRNETFVVVVVLRKARSCLSLHYCINVKDISFEPQQQILQLRLINWPRTGN